MVIFTKLFCQLAHCGDKAKYYLPCYSKYVCGGCKQGRYFDDKVLLLVDPSEVKRALQYIEYNLQTIQNNSIEKKIGQIKEAQDRKKTKSSKDKNSDKGSSKELKSDKEEKKDEKRPKREVDLYTQVENQSYLAKETLKDPKCKAFLESILSSKSVKFKMWQKVDFKVAKILTKYACQHLEDTVNYMGCVDAATAKFFLNTCIPPSLPYLNLGFHNGRIRTPIAPYLPSVLALKPKITTKLILTQAIITEEEKEILDKAFIGIVLEYSQIRMENLGP